MINIQRANNKLSFDESKIGKANMLGNFTRAITSVWLFETQACCHREEKGMNSVRCLDLSIEINLTDKHFYQ